ncbi:MAG: lysylphosphatidylglycerol synthase transmembrane domain-containing protein [Planctomycetota bacterium]
MTAADAPSGAGSANAAPAEKKDSAPPKRSSWRKRLFLLVRLAVGVGLLWWVFHKFIKVEEIRDLARRTDRGLLILGLVTELLPIFITTFRWQLLLRPVEIRLGFLRTLHFNYLGLFFNNFLIGLTGGDLMKAILIARGTDRRAAAVLTVFVDRLVGLVTLALIAGLACFARLGNRDFLVAAAIVWGFLASFALFCLVYFNRRLRSAQWVRRLRRRLPGREILIELDDAGRAYRGQWGVLSGAFALSVFGHAASIGGAFILARSLGSTVSLVDVLIYFPVVMMIASVPISIGTWGVGEAAFVGFFRKVGMPDATAVGLSLLVRLSQALWTLPGGLLLAIDPAERKAVKEAEEEAKSH